MRQMGMKACSFTGVLKEPRIVEKKKRHTHTPYSNICQKQLHITA